MSAALRPSEPPSYVHAKHLPPRAPDSSPGELPRKPALSKRKKEERARVLAAFCATASRWPLSERDFAAVAEVAKKTADDTLTGQKPMHVESIFLLDDERALEVFDAFRDAIRDRRRARQLALGHR